MEKMEPWFHNGKVSAINVSMRVLLYRWLIYRIKGIFHIHRGRPE